MNSIPEWVLELLEDEGKQWIKSFKLTAPEWEGVEYSYRIGKTYVGAQSLLWNCGAREICANWCVSIPTTLGLLLYAGSNSSHGLASLIVATANQYQKQILTVLISMGFTTPTAWVRNPNSGNNICLTTFNLNPAWFIQPEEEEEEDEEWGVLREELEDDF